VLVVVVIIISGKKDPGIPNRFPFKEQLLQEAEKKKQQVMMMYFVIVLTSGCKMDYLCA